MQWHAQVIIRAHRVEKKRHATAAIRSLAEGMVNLAGADDRLRVRSPHPVDRGVNLVVRDVHAMANDHWWSLASAMPRRGQGAIRLYYSEIILIARYIPYYFCRITFPRSSR